MKNYFVSLRLVQSLLVISRDRSKSTNGVWLEKQHSHIFPSLVTGRHYEI